MSVHYKFKAALDFSTVSFDGIHISVADLKEAIIDQKKLAKNADFDLQIMNAQTNEVYEDDTTLIPKNTSVTVARVPITEKRKQPGGYGGPGGAQNRNRGPHQTTAPLPSSIAKGVDLASMDGTEEEKILEMMNQSTADFDPSNYQRLRGHGQYGKVPPSYRCYRCHMPGHWIKDCTAAASEVVPVDIKKSTGIPRSFMVAVDGPQVPGALITPEGRYAVPAVDHAAYLEKNKPKPKVEATPKPKIPDELLCNLCQDLLTDALLVPCCAVSYCDDCIRSALLESEEQECPGCHDKGITPNTLIPSRFLRTAVIAFKNETGYSKPPKVVEPPAPITVDLTESGKKSPQRLSLDELPDDLFPHSPRKIDHDSQASKKEEPEPDLYDFNDGSIPQLGSQAVPKDGSQTSTIRTIGPPQPFQHYDRNMYRHRMPFQQPNMPPMHHPQNPPMHYPPMQPKPLMEREPPPPGFDVPPPGEEKPPGDDRRYRPGMEPNGGPPPNMRPMQGPGPGMPFDPNLPPPGFPPGMPPPGMVPYGGPPPVGYPYPNQYRGPPTGPPMYPGPPRHDDPYYRDRDRDRRRTDYDRDRDRDRGRGRDSRERARDRDRRNDEARTIDDPLEEFNRLMREKDRRKQIGAAGPVKRSRSPSYSPSRRPPSPFLKAPARSRSRTFSRSPSPKRKRVVVARRGSPYSRSRSRSPLRRPLARVRSPSPLRRSPRRAPPYSPSPPPGLIRNPPRLYENDDYYDSRSRHEQSRYGSKRYSRDREREPLRETDPRHEAKYETKKPSKVDSSAPPSKHQHDRERERDRERPPVKSRSSEKDRRSRDRDRDREKHDRDSAAPPDQTSGSLLKPDYLNESKQSRHRSPAPARSRTESSSKDKDKGSTSNSKDRVTDSHRTKHAPAPETKVVDEKSPKKVKKDKKKHKKKSRDEKEKKSRKKKGKGEGDTEEDQSVTSGSRRESSETQKDELEHAPEISSTEKLEPTSVVCDSTVKSPVDAKSQVTTTTNSVIKELAFDPMYKSAKDEGEVAHSVDSVTQRTYSAETTTTKPEGELTSGAKPQSPQVAIPPSKWDRDEDDASEPKEKENTDVTMPVQTSETNAEPEKADRKAVTTEVIKRAENAVFNKAINAIRTDTKVSESRAKHEEKSPERAKEIEVRREAKKKRDSIEITVKTTEGVPEPKAKIPVRERLGSKVTDADRSDKPQPLMKSVVFPPTTSKDKTVSKTRSRSRERPRRSSSNPRRDTRDQPRDLRDEIRSRARSPERRRSRSPLVLGPKVDRSRNEPRERDRNRRADDDRDRRDVGRRSDDAKGRERERDRSSAQDRSRNDARDRPAARRSRERSPPRRSRSPRRTSRSPYRSSRYEERDRDNRRLKSSVEVKGIEGVFEKVQPSPPGAGSQGILIIRTNQEENWKLSDKFVPIGAHESGEASKQAGESASASSKMESSDLKKPASPVPLSVRKQKGRINIKLSASSKAEDKNSSSAASSDDDEDDDEDGKSSDEGKKKKHKDKKNKAKRRRSNSTSSSSEEDEKSKKKKKAKKKKKKSKKKSK